MSRLVVTGGRWHRYALDGERVPTVTGVVGKAVAKPGLLRWSARSAAEWAAAHADELPSMGEGLWTQRATEAADMIRDASANAGKQVHFIAQRLVFGEPVETDDPDTGEPYADDVVRMGSQVAHFMDRWDVTPDTALVECPVFNEDEKYAGTFDLVATLRDSKRWLIDYKTGQSGVYPETALQLVAYRHATHVVIGERDMLMPPIDRCAALWVRPDGWELLPVRTDDLVWETFRHAIRVAEFASMKRDDVIAAPLPIPKGD